MTEPLNLAALGQDIAKHLADRPDVDHALLTRLSSTRNRIHAIFGDHVVVILIDSIKEAP